jgi:MFS family permease
MNRTIKLLMISDTLMSTGFGLIAPILAIFIKENLVGGTILAAGLASTIFFITKSIIQLPFSRYVDEHDNKRLWLIIGAFMITTVPFIYIFAENINTIFIAQIIHGIGAGILSPAWLGLWSINLDKRHESFEWSLYYTTSELGTGITAFLGATMAQILGFTYTFILVGVFSFIGSLILLELDQRNEKTKPKLNTHYHKKRRLKSYY